MKIRLALALALVWGFATQYSAQKFWHPTYSYPGGSKLSIALANDSCVFVSLPGALLRSCNAGHH